MLLTRVTGGATAGHHPCRADWVWGTMRTVHSKKIRRVRRASCTRTATCAGRDGLSPCVGARLAQSPPGLRLPDALECSAGRLMRQPIPDSPLNIPASAQHPRICSPSGVARRGPTVHCDRTGWQTAPRQLAVRLGTDRPAPAEAVRWYRVATGTREIGTGGAAGPGALTAWAVGATATRRPGRRWSYRRVPLASGIAEGHRVPDPTGRGSRRPPIRVSREWQTRRDWQPRREWRDAPRVA